MTCPRPSSRISPNSLSYRKSISSSNCLSPMNSYRFSIPVWAQPNLSFEKLRPYICVEETPWHTYEFTSALYPTLLQRTPVLLRLSKSGRPFAVFTFPRKVLRLSPAPVQSARQMYHSPFQGHFRLGERKYYRTISAKADIYLSGIAQLISVPFVDALHKLNYFRSIRKYLVA